MAEFQTVCTIDDLPEGLGRTFWVDDKPIALFRVNSEVYAIDDTCPHMGASLGSGFVENDTVTCPWHFWRFRLADGKWADNPRLGIGSYPARVVGNDVQIQIITTKDEGAKT
jgi:nitrite reductase (NADH) small subunit